MQPGVAPGGTPSPTATAQLSCRKRQRFRQAGLRTRQQHVAEIHAGRSHLPASCDAVAKHAICWTDLPLRGQCRHWCWAIKHRTGFPFHPSFYTSGT